jgi:zinc transporter 2
MFFVLHANTCAHSIPHHGHSHSGNHGHSHSNESLIINILPENVPKQSISTKNINVKAAMIHVIGDFVQSVGVLFAAILIKIKVC